MVDDHLGLGPSDKLWDYSSALLEQTNVALVLWQHLSASSAHLFTRHYDTCEPPSCPPVETTASAQSQWSRWPRVDPRTSHTGMSF